MAARRDDEQQTVAARDDLTDGVRNGDDGIAAKRSSHGRGEENGGGGGGGGGLKRWSKGSGLGIDALDDGSAAEFTPPLPNGERRLHPLLDEERIAKEAATAATAERGLSEGLSDTHLDGKNDNGSNVSASSSSGQKASEHETLRIIESMATEPGYPSPSGGFVPPVTGQDWSLSDAPVTRARRATSSSSAGKQLRDRMASSGSAGSATEAHITSARRTSATATAAVGASSSSSSSTTTSQAHVAAPKPVKTAALAFLEGAGSRGGAAHHRNSSSLSSDLASFDEAVGHSQAISARSSPSTVPPTKRRSSALADVLNAEQRRSAGTSGQDDDGGSVSQLPPLKVRDYAFDESDPRHVGARDVGLPSPAARASGSASDLMSGGGMGRGMGMSLGLGGVGAHHAGSHEWGATADEYDEDEDEDGDEEEDINDGGSGLVSNQQSSSSLGRTGLPLGLYYAAYDFCAESEHELDVKVGHRVRLIGHVDGGWAIVVRVREGDEDIEADDEGADKGLVPEAYLQWLGH